MQALIRSLEKEVADKKQQLLDNQKHVVVLTKQRENEKDTFENKLAKLEEQVGIQCVKIFLLKTFLKFSFFRLVKD